MSGSQRLRAARDRRAAALRVALEASANLNAEEREVLRTSRAARQSMAALACQRTGGSVPAGDYIAGQTRGTDVRLVQAALHRHLHPGASRTRGEADLLARAGAEASSR